VPQYQAPNVYLLFLMHVSDWSKTPNETSQIEDFILSHLSMKESEAEAQYAAVTADDTEAPTASNSTLKTVANFSYFDEITEVEFSMSQTSFYPYCEAGTGKKIGVEHINVMTYSTLQDTVSPTAAPTSVTRRKKSNHDKKSIWKESTFSDRESIIPGHKSRRPETEMWKGHDQRRAEGGPLIEDLTVLLFPLTENWINITAEVVHIATNISNSTVVVASYESFNLDSAYEDYGISSNLTACLITWTISVGITETDALSAILMPSYLPTMMSSIENEMSAIGFNVTVLEFIGGSCCVGFCGGPGCEGRHETCYCDEFCEEQGDCCADYVTTCEATTSSGYWECDNGEEIPSSYVCDWYYDCADGSDESACDYDYDYDYGGTWECDNGEVIPWSWYCDFFDDCADGTDENNCDYNWWLYYYSTVDGFNVDCGNDVSKSSCAECALSASEAHNCAGECVWLESDYSLNQTEECVQGYVCTDDTTVIACGYCSEDNCEGESCMLDDTGTCTEAVCDVPSLAYIGDGWCDDALGSYNTQECGYDGGDCCEDTCSISTYECGSNGYNCLDPQSESYGAALRVDDSEIPYDIAPFLLLLDMKFFAPSINARKYQCHTSFTMYVPEDAGYLIETMVLITRNNYMGLSKKEFMDLVDNELWTTMPIAGGEAPLLEGFNMQIRYIEEYVDGKSKIITETDSSPQNNHVQHIIWEPFRTVTYYESYVSYTYGQWFSSAGANYALATSVFFLLLIFVPRKEEDYGILGYMSMEYKNTNKVMELKHELDDELAVCRMKLQKLPGHKKH